jgi:hypothetical protein
MLLPSNFTLTRDGGRLNTVKSGGVFEPRPQREPAVGLTGRIEGTHLAADTRCMAKKPESSKPTTWNIYKIASKAVWLGAVEAPDGATAMEKAAAEFKVPANRLMAIRR